MSNSWGNIYLAVAIASLIVGLVGHSQPIIDGLGKAFSGVFLILFLIVRLFGEKNA